MDILTPKGQITAAQERRAIEVFRGKYPDLAYMHTRKDAPVTIDALLVKNNTVVAAVETKCRKMTMEDLKAFDDEWLITFDKIVDGRRIAQELAVPFVGLLYLVPEDVLIVQKICDELGDFIVPMKIKKTETQATVNGGTIKRWNAYLKLTNPTIIEGANYPTLFRAG